jgi:hypothetical protein
MLLVQRAQGVGGLNRQLQVSPALNLIWSIWAVASVSDCDVVYVIINGVTDSSDGVTDSTLIQHAMVDRLSSF